MFSAAIKRSLASTSRLAIRRQLSYTSVVRNATTTEAIYTQAVESIGSEPINWEESTKKVLQSLEEVKAVPILNPVYLALAEPLLPSRCSHSPNDEAVVELDPTVFAHPIRRDILRLCVIQHLDGLRQGSGNTKTRSEVRGSGRKIRPQKGSGRARLGDGQSPMLRGGGIAFGPKPRDFSTKLPRKVVEMGMRVALSAKVREQKLGLVEELDWPCAKTSPLAKRIDLLGWRKTLIVTGDSNFTDGIQRAAQNLQEVGLVTVEDLTVYDVVKWQRLVLDVKAVEYFERTLGKDVPIVPLV